jgi:hypothetical protein
MKRLLIPAFILILGGSGFARGSADIHGMRMTFGQDAPLPYYFTESKNLASILRHWRSSGNFGSTVVYVPNIKEANARALKDFQSRFKDVEEAKWFSDENGYYSYFIKDGFNNRAFYNKSGRWQYSIIYKTEDKLPRDLRATVKSVYFDWNINVAEEIRTNEGVIYLVYMENKTNFRVLKLNSDNEMETFENIVKQ